MPPICMRRVSSSHQRAPAKLLAAHRESTALVVCEPKRPRTKLLAEDAILLSEIVDQIFLVTIHLAAEAFSHLTTMTSGIIKASITS